MAPRRKEPASLSLEAAAPPKDLPPKRPRGFIEVVSGADGFPVHQVYDGCHFGLASFLHREDALFFLHAKEVCPALQDLQGFLDTAKKSILHAQEHCSAVRAEILNDTTIATRGRTRDALEDLESALRSLVGLHDELDGLRSKLDD